MKFILAILLVFVSVCLVKGDSSWGRCPKVTHEQKTFELERYLGKWYEIARLQATPFEKGDCNTAEYSLRDDGEVRVINTEVRPEGYNSVEGRAEKTEDPFVLKVVFSDSFWAQLFKGDYRVVKTDYENFAIVFSCTDIVFAKLEYVWILSRTSEITESKKAELIDYINHNFGYNRESFRFSNHAQDYCHYQL